MSKVALVVTEPAPVVDEVHTRDSLGVALLGGIFQNVGVRTPFPFVTVDDVLARDSFLEMSNFID